LIIFLFLEVQVILVVTLMIVGCVFLLIIHAVLLHGLKKKEWKKEKVKDRGGGGTTAERVIN
jgi:hypothetical protein